MRRAADCPENIKKEICINKMLDHENVVSEEKSSYSTSQPEPGTGGTLWDSGAATSIDRLVQGISFSQPACPEHMLLNSQLLGTPGTSQGVQRCSLGPPYGRGFSGFAGFVSF
ncbi:serine threonine-protein kinase chk1 [Limosa lapponica baueri]|uniref:Serine threonine-protein kinase chk1 n=1 Tax=Limosa lapponica baueri TaxID=1758121 RepID=A0A2I0T8D9_LIMLA|nr:serine threonine-protein kinase chk1 [Limosa lapponica baueri]